MSIFKYINKDTALVIAIVVVIFLIIQCNNGQKKVANVLDEVTENFMSEDVLAPSSMPEEDLVQQEVVKMEPANTEDNLGDFYEDNLKGGDDEYEVTGDDRRAPRSNYDDEYGLGVDLNDPQFKALGAVPDTNKLISDDLLPKKKEDWFEAPDVGTNVEDANLMADALFRGGVNTLSNVNKNPSLDIRGDIPVPKINVGAFNQSSYNPGSKTQGLCL